MVETLHRGILKVVLERQTEIIIIVGFDGKTFPPYNGETALIISVLVEAKK